ncbi:MAG: hypothetical protein K1000chlam3_01111 [Chlamydiae bacterium]|nr:hypothetical protein [Chlamydiota bacterium]
MSSNPVAFSSIAGGNQCYQCSICFNEEIGPFVVHSDGGDKHPIHKICAKKMVNADEVCAFCRKVVNLSSLLTPAEIAERNNQLSAEEIVFKEEQKENDRVEALRLDNAFLDEDQILYDNDNEIQNYELITRIEEDDEQTRINKDAAVARALQDQDQRGINPCLAATVLVVAVIVGAVAKDYFI